MEINEICQALPIIIKTQKVEWSDNRNGNLSHPKYSDEVLNWIVLLTEIERKLIWMRANRKPWREVCGTLGLCRSGANEKLNGALDYLSEVIGDV